MTKALVLRNHRSHLLEHPRLYGQHLSHHRVQASADGALNAQFIPHAGNLSQQAFDLPAEKFESDRRARAAGQMRLLRGKSAG